MLFLRTVNVDNYRNHTLADSLPVPVMGGSVLSSHNVITCNLINFLVQWEASRAIELLMKVLSAICIKAFLPEVFNGYVYLHVM